MKKIIIGLSLALILSVNAQAEIKNKQMLNGFFQGCVEGNDPELTNMIGIGGQFEYCGCMVNSISKSMNARGLIKLGLDVLETEGGVNNDSKVTTEQLKIFLNNEGLKQGLLDCFSKVL
jgi:hypothetical protein